MSERVIAKIVAWPVSDNDSYGYEYEADPDAPSVSEIVDVLNAARHYATLHIDTEKDAVETMNRIINLISRLEDA